MEKRTPSRWLTLLAACFGLLMLYIDLFIVNVALPTIGHDFRAPSVRSPGRFQAMC
jgi:MFS transporter, DHA2 family, methylenomycin A resistance protein